MDPATLSDVELKAAAYEQLLQIELCQNNVQVIRAELARRAQQRPVVAQEAQGPTSEQKAA